MRDSWFDLGLRWAGPFMYAGAVGRAHVFRCGCRTVELRICTKIELCVAHGDERDELARTMVANRVSCVVGLAAQALAPPRPDVAR